MKGDWRAAAARRFAAVLVLAVAGAVLALATTGTWRVVGWAAVGVAVTLIISLFFLEVGYSEDRARSRDPRG
jgi:uncharacterized membrane protein